MGAAGTGAIIAILLPFFNKMTEQKMKIDDVLEMNSFYFSSA